MTSGRDDKPQPRSGSDFSPFRPLPRLVRPSRLMPKPTPATAALSPLDAPDFDLAATLNCGQVFHWRPTGPGYVGVIDRTPLYVEQRGDTLLVTPGTARLAARYFALDHPLPAIYATLPADPFMQTALAACRGLRLIRQPLWECLATFITSALKQVSHIAAISQGLRRRYGTPLGTLGGHELHAYPTPARLAALQEADLRACGLGFRARSLLEAARAVASADGTSSQPTLESLCPLDRAATLAALTRFRGVGTKVANCVLLFAYEHLDAFPIDVWIERVLRERYFPNEPDAPLGQLQAFAQTYFGPYGGYAQQYLFHHARTTTPRRPPPAKPTETVPPIRRVRAKRNA